jgi:hypothetical protein
MVDRVRAADSPRAERIALGSGVVFVILALIAFLIAGGPDNGASSDQVLSYFRDHDTALRWQALLFGLSGGFFLWFGGTLASVIRRAEGDPAGRIPAIVVGAVGASTAIYFVGMASWLTVAEIKDGALLYYFGNRAFALTNFSAAVVVLAVSLGVLRTRILVEWVAVVGAAVTVLLLVNGVAQALSDSDAVSSLGTITFLVFLAWVLTVSGLLASQRVPALRPGRAAV